MNTALKEALSALAEGDFSTRIPVESFDGDNDVARLVNEIASRNQALASQVAHLARVVGKEGKIDQRGQMKDATGDWQAVIDSVNDLIEDTAVFRERSSDRAQRGAAAAGATFVRIAGRISTASSGTG